MAGHFNESMSQTMHDFKYFVEPVFKKLWRDCVWFSNENAGNALADYFDTCSGIDLWQVNPESKIIKGVASRIQRSDKCYETFTVRFERETGTETEYSKRLHAIRNGGLYPELTYQAYISAGGERFSALAVAKTVDIFRFIEKESVAVKKTGNDQIGQANFFVINWDDMKTKGYEIVIVKRRDSSLECYAKGMNFTLPLSCEAAHD